MTSSSLSTLFLLSILSCSGCSTVKNQLLDEAMALFPENPHVFWLRGRALMDRNCLAEAVPFFERLIHWGKRNDFDHSISYDTKIFNIHAYDSLATCFFRLGRYSQSEKYFEIARRCAPEQIEYTAKAALCALRKTSLKGTASKADSADLTWALTFLRKT